MTRSRWVVDRKALADTERASFESMDILLREPREQVTLDSRSGMSRMTLQRVYYVKTFSGRGSRIKQWLGISRYQRELRNLRYFAELGLGTPAVVAYGYESRLGLFQRAVLVTSEVRDASDLEQFIKAGKLYRDGVGGARKILAALAHVARLLHSQGFYHRDLKTRNILVRRAGPQPELFFFDCPSGRRPPRFMMRRAMVRDLAHLERGLRGHVRRTDLLYMYKQYRGCSSLGPQDKALARDALSYCARRRKTPTDTRHAG